MDPVLPPIGDAERTPLVAELLAIIETEREKSRQLRGDKQQLENDKRELQARIAELEAQKSNLEAELTQAQARIEKLESDNRESQARVEALQSDKTKLEAELAGARQVKEKEKRMPAESQTSPGADAKPAKPSRTFARIRLALAAILFIGWLVYLGYLALGHTRPVVISRAQLMLASYLIKTELTLDASGKPKSEVRVLESFGQHKLTSDTITVDNLADARLPGNKPLAAAGTYLLFLEAMNPGPPDPANVRFRIVSATMRLENETRSVPLIYPWSPDVERQIHELTSSQ